MLAPLRDAERLLLRCALLIQRGHQGLPHKP